MYKRLLSFALALLLCLTCVSPALAADSGSHFMKQADYAGQFTDIKDADWFSGYVKQSYEYGLLQGSSATGFGPGSTFSAAEAITLAARVHSISRTGTEPDAAAAPGEPWYAPYVAYALKNAIITADYNNYTAVALRHEVALMLFRALPSDTLVPIRTVENGEIPDLYTSAPYANAVYTLYRAGILSGSDAAGSFRPDSGITRSEIAAIAVRIADPAQRSSALLGAASDTGAALTAQQIAEKCAPAVFFIQTYALNGEAAGTGSGFFISSDGLAVTNYHVAANSSYLEIRTTDGKTYHDVDIIDTDGDNDLVLLRVKGFGFSWLEVGDSSALKQGQQVYALGSPLGLDNTLSQGIVSHANRVLDGVGYIQISVPIAPGSSGGALLDDRGRVVGVTSAGFVDSTGDLNLAVPISRIGALDRSSTESYVCWGDTFYPGFAQAYDFGAFSGVELLSYTPTLLGYSLTYDAFDFHGVFEATDADAYSDTLYYYYAALLNEGFEQTEAVNSFMGTFETATEAVEILADLSGSQTIQVTAWKIPQYYAEHPALPDLGWYSGLEADGGARLYNGSTIYVYNWAEYYTEDAFSAVLDDYFYLLVYDGFTYRGGEQGSLLFEGNGLSVVFSVTDTALYVDVLPL